MKCPKCKSKYIIKNGTYRGKKRTYQNYKCNSCGKTFSEKKLKNKQYRPKIILKSITLYNLGHTLKQTSKKINKQFHVKTYPQLISKWLNQYKTICTYKRIRKKTNKNLLFSKEFNHKQTYKFMYHKLKVKKFINNYFQNLRKYFYNIPKNCPNKLFINNNSRASQIQLNTNPAINEKKNYACKLSGLALKANKDNKKRHNEIQKFMLCNDSSTLAVEVPVWLHPYEFDNFQLFKNFRKTITGHIDIVQQRYGLIHILDYKPKAKKENPISQLFFYAFALSKRTDVWLRNFKCAWFDHHGYYEFDPNGIVLINEDLRKAEKKKYKLNRKKQLYHENRMFREMEKENQEPNKSRDMK